jgi:YYY domain-containing protein
MTYPVSAESNLASPKKRLPIWVIDLLLIVVLAAGAYLRAAGLYWGEYQYLHPDERFLVWVGTDISPTKIVDTADGVKKSWISLSEYFDTPNSSLNPNNRGHGFYVYGTLPMFLTRFAVEWIFGRSGFDVMTQVGRALSALVDLLTVLLVYLVAARLYDRRVGLLAAAFSAATVLQIQQSHFFTMDTFSSFFAFLSIYFAVRIMTDQKPWPNGISEKITTENLPEQLPKKRSPWIVATLSEYIRQPIFWLSLAFGLAYGAAMASKISIIPIAFLLPAAIAIRISRMPRNEWSQRAVQALVYLVVAGLVSMVIFRLTQPYAFSGPGFFGVKLNQAWEAQMREQRNQATDEVDFPPAMQWARRPVWFSLQNLTIWGLGLPLGLLSWAGFLWAGWDMLKGRWRTHLLLWGWTAFYFTWQSLALNPTMRYQLPIYPCLAIFAAWGVIHLWDIGVEKRNLALAQAGRARIRWQQVAAILIGAVVLVSTFSYAYAFTGIYTQPITRIEGSRWIYQNIPGPINLLIDSAEGTVNQPLPFAYNSTLMAPSPYIVNFTPQVTGTVSDINLPFVQVQRGGSEIASLGVKILDAEGNLLGVGNIPLHPDQADPRGDEYMVKLDQPVNLEKNRGYVLLLESSGEPPTALLDKNTTLGFINQNGDWIDIPAFQVTDPAWKRLSYETTFTAPENGLLIDIFLPVTDRPLPIDNPVNLVVSTQEQDSPSEPAQEILQAEPITQDDNRGPGYLFRLATPVYLNENESLNLKLSLPVSSTAITLNGAGIANEGEWDDGMPLRIDGYDGFGGIYPLDLNFNMYWDDTPEKLERFIRILDQSEYIVITSNRQWGSLARIPERFPMTTTYYRNLLGCPIDQDIVWCYRVAKPGTFTGNLGYDLIQTFDSDPSIGSLSLNDQFAEEAFTVYDHPKVFIFKKHDTYDSGQVRTFLSSIDFDKVIRIPPLKFNSNPADLMLPLQRWLQHQAGGTWSELFNPQAVQNSSQVASAVIWYLGLALLGVLAYPILRLAFPGLSDKGYPLARIAGLLILSYPVWIAGSYQIPYTQATISIVILAMALLAVILIISNREEFRQEWRQHKRYYLMVEGLFLAFFLFGLLIRWGNPDLWHPYKGGEKPMDFSYFNAVLKSSSFPPYDPWFAGGYLNYYYYGFVLVGALVKWLGITPAIAYNLILPSMFAMIGMGAFSISWNIYTGRTEKNQNDPGGGRKLHPFWVGLAGALGMALLGNLGTVKMIYEGYQRIVAAPGALEGSNLVMRLYWAAQGFLKNLTGTPLPYGIGDWYWNPSRVIPAPGDVEPITEFPFFTVLYADLHAHLFSLALVFLALAFSLSVILARGRWRGLAGGIFGFVLGGLSIGVLKPTNTWDFYPYLVLGVIALVYSLWRYYQTPEKINRYIRIPGFFKALPQDAQRLIVTLGAVALLVGLSYLFFRPFDQWYGQAYGKVNFWQGLRTPLTAYLTHWGVFLFVIVSWLLWETRDWLASTPVSSLRKLAPYRDLIIGAFAFLFLLTLALAIKLPGSGQTPFGRGIAVAWLALPLATWAGVLILRPGQPDARRFTLFMIGTGLVLTLMVEVVVLVGDIGRMNTVFKFYLQVWTLFAVSAATALGWLLEALPGWLPRWRTAWSAALALLVAGALLYPLTAGRAKIMDRMSDQAPRSLDGMEYMAYATYDWQGPMDLSQDYRAIRWMQENVSGSPVIVEANLRDLYRWGSRFTINTGLPGVVGWEWHQQQQRALVPGFWISERIAEIDQFYNSTDLAETIEFLRKYNVQYIILGQLERNHYPGPGLDKFDAQNGKLWQEVYRDGNTRIFKVITTQLES